MMGNRLFIGTTEMATKADLETKQDRLVSGTNIKTINNESILGEGNVDLVPCRLNTTSPLNPNSNRLNACVYVDDNGTNARVSLRGLINMYWRVGEDVPADMQPDEYIFIKKGE